MDKSNIGFSWVACGNGTGSRVRSADARALIACAAIAVISGGFSSVVNASPSGIGLTGIPTNLTGAGVNIGQVEASTSSAGSGTQSSPYQATFEVSTPAAGPVVTYIGDAPSDYYPTSPGASAPGSQPNVDTTTGVLHTFTVNSSSSYYQYGVSAHANSVAGYLWGTNGVAPGVSYVDNYSANWFLSSVVGTYYSTGVNKFAPVNTLHGDSIINQSFTSTFPASDTAQQQLQEEQQLNLEYDAYSNYYGTLFVSAVGDGATTNSNSTVSLAVNPPSTAYNSISVSASALAANNATNGPTLTGLSSPDIIAPGQYSSYSTPLVSGAAALLVQAGNNMANTNAVQAQTVKALLMNGADKADNWAPSAGNSLNQNVGAGSLDVYQSYQNLEAGQHAAAAVNSSSTPITVGTADPLEGWDFSAASSTRNNVSHYLLNLPAAAIAGHLTATLVWNAQTSLSYGHIVGTSLYGLAGASSEAFNSLYLYLYNATTGALVSKSTSTNDNTQTIFTSLASLTPGDQYDLQVFDAGYQGSTPAGFTLNTSDPYALAWNVVATPEPAALLLLACGMLPLMMRRKSVRA